MKSLWLKVVLWSVLVVFTTLMILFIIALRPELWSTQILDYLNNSWLSRKGIVLHFSSLQGNIFSSFRFDSVRVYSQKDSLLLAADKVEFSFDVKSLLKKKLDLNYLRIVHPGFNEKRLKEFIQNLGFSSTRTKIPFFQDSWSIQKFEVEEGYGDFFRGIYLSQLDLVSSLDYAGDSLTIHSHFASFQVGDLQRSFSIPHALMVLKPGKLEVNTLLMEVGKDEIQLSGYINLETFMGEIDLGSDVFHPYGILANLTTIPFQKEDRIRLRSNLSFNSDSVTVVGTVDGLLFGHEIRDGGLALSLTSDRIELERVNFRSGSTLIEMDGKFLKERYSRFRLKVTNFDLAEWLDVAVKTDINGDIRIRGGGKLVKEQDWWISLNLQSGRVIDFPYESMRGILRYNGGSWKTIDSLRVTIPGGQIVFQGSGNLRSGKIKGGAMVAVTDFTGLREVFQLSEINGRGDGSVKVSGLMEDPNIRGYLELTDFSFGKYANFDSCWGNFDVSQVFSSRRGKIDLHARDGSILQENLKQVNVLAEVKQDTIRVQSAEFRKGVDFVRFAGEIVGSERFYINKFTSNYKSNLISTLEPFQVILRENDVRVSPVQIRFNAGLISGNFQRTGQEGLNLDLSVENIRLERLGALFRQKGRLFGLFSGTGTLSYMQQGLTGELQFTLQEGGFHDYHFRQVMGDLSFTTDSILFSNFTILDTSGAQIVFNGSLSSPKTLSIDSLFSGNSILQGIVILHNLPLKDYAPLIKFPYRVGGRLTGRLLLSGELSDPVIGFKYGILKPEFERLEADSLFAAGRYEDFRTIFTQIRIKGDGGEYKGYGYLPLDLRLKGRGAKFWLRDDPINMTFTGRISRFSPLERYVEEVEKVKGEIRVALSISGTPAHPIRNGNIIVKNTIVDLNSFENPIENVHGSAIITNNVMELVSCSGRMIQAEGGSKWSRVLDFLTPGINRETRQNLFVSGKLDLRYFFNPRFDLKIKGENIYVRMPLGMEEGVVDVNLSVQGRDTIVVEGEIYPEEFYIREEFTSAAPSIVEEKKEGKKYYSYNIHVPISGNVFLQNSEADAEFEGDIYLVRRAQEPITYSGVVNIRQGKFYYYRDEFTIEEGTIQFKPFEFNPQFYIKGVLAITPAGSNTSPGEEDYITITLTGELKKPEIYFSSSNGKYSQSDIIALLTVNQPIEQNQFDPRRLQSESASVLSYFLEREIEQSAKRLSPFDVFDIRTTGNFFSPNEMSITSILLGRRLLPNLYLTYERSLTFSDPAQQLGLEYRLSRTTSIVGEIDQDGLIHLRYRYKYQY